MQNSILEQARALARPGKEADLASAQELLMNHLVVNPYDTDAWLLLTRIECNSPFDDADRITHYAEHVLSYDPSNAYALLFLAYADYCMRGSSNNDLYDKLCMAKSDDIIIKSMIEIAKAQYFEFRDHKKCEEALKKSIQYCPTHVINFRMLGQLYIRQGNSAEGKLLIEQGTQNFKNFFKHHNIETWGADCTSIMGHLYEFFAGL